MYLAFALGAFVVVQYPDVCGNAGVVKQLIRQGDNRLQPVVFDNPLADAVLATTGLAGKQGRTVKDNPDTTATRILPNSVEGVSFC